MHARSLAFGLAGVSHDIDPYIAIFHRRVSMFRRYLSKNPCKQVLVAEIYHSYGLLQYPGCYSADADLSSLEPAPLPGSEGRQHWKASTTPHGPVGLLLQNTHYLAATIDMDRHIIHMHAHAPIHYMTMPFQLLKPALLDMAFDAVHRVVSETRSVLHDLPTLDVGVFQAALHSDDMYHNNVIHMVSTLSAVDQSALHRFNVADSDVCIFCKSCPSSVHHVLWHCTHPTLVQARHDTSHDAQTYLLEQLSCVPLPLLYGLPPKLALLPCSPWWTNEGCSSLHDSTIPTHVRSYQQYDARTAFRVLNGAGKHFEIPARPACVNGIPPASPNSYSDGSFTNPKRP
eukprot:10818703-Karenia_brevis.AAC.1